MNFIKFPAVVLDDYVFFELWLYRNGVSQRVVLSLLLEICMYIQSILKKHLVKKWCLRHWRHFKDKDSFASQTWNVYGKSFRQTFSIYSEKMIICTIIFSDHTNIRKKMVSDVRYFSKVEKMFHELFQILEKSLIIFFLIEEDISTTFRQRKTMRIHKIIRKSSDNRVKKCCVWWNIFIMKRYWRFRKNIR